jgi:putative flavoprotein involved in K+ transport
MDTTHTEHIETVIIGAGQAGLATGYHLQRQGRPFVILDAGSRVGDNWRRQWDSLRLYSPAHVDGPPGLPFPAPRWTFPGGGPDRSGVLSLSLSPTASSA